MAAQGDRPAGEHLDHLSLHLRIGAARSSRHVERVVGVLKGCERCGAAELFDERRKQTGLGERVARALKEQQRDPYFKEMLRAGGGRLSRWMQRKSEKKDSAQVGQRA